MNFSIHLRDPLQADLDAFAQTRQTSRSGVIREAVREFRRVERLAVEDGSLEASRRTGKRDRESSVTPLDSMALWQRTLAPQDDPLDARREVLRQALLGFREARRRARANARCRAAQPERTRHYHLDALWRVADQIAGPDYPINPAEAFVLGGAFLLHDAAHVMAAYPGGIFSIKETIQWQDLIAQRYGGRDPERPQRRGTSGVVPGASLPACRASAHAREAGMDRAERWSEAAFLGASGTTRVLRRSYRRNRREPSLALASRGRGVRRSKGLATGVHAACRLGDRCAQACVSIAYGGCGAYRRLARTLVTVRAPSTRRHIGGSLAIPGEARSAAEDSEGRAAHQVRQCVLARRVQGVVAGWAAGRCTVTSRGSRRASSCRMPSTPCEPFAPWDTSEQTKAKSRSEPSVPTGRLVAACHRHRDRHEPPRAHERAARFREFVRAP